MKPRKIICPLVGEGHPLPLLKEKGGESPVLVADFDAADYPALMRSMKNVDDYVIVRFSETCIRAAQCVEVTLHEIADAHPYGKRPKTRTERISARLIPLAHTEVLGVDDGEFVL